MDKVEITNVGGLQGLASEATLQQLLLATRKGKGDSARAQDLYNRSLNQSVKKQTSYQGQVSKTEKALSIFEKSIRTSNARLSEFVEGIVGNSNFLSRSINRLTYVVDENVDRWRSLSQVGAGFNNSLTDIIKTSTLSNMSLEEFTNVVMNNSEILRSFGSTVTEGSVEFGKISRELRRGFGRELMSMGFTFDEVNEVLMSYMDISRRSLRQDRMSQREILAGTEAYALELDKLTRLTGMSRRQAQETMQQQMTDQRIRMRTANMTVEEQARFQSNLARANTEADGFGEVLAQLAAGDPGDEFTRLMRVMAPEVLEGAANMQNMSAGEFHNFMIDAREAVDQLAAEQGEASVAFLSRTNAAFGQLFGFTAQLSRLGGKLTAEEEARMDAEMAARNEVTQIFGNFSEVLRQVTTTFRGLFMNLDEFGNEIVDPQGRESFFGALKTLSTTIRNLFSPSSGSVTGVMDNFMGKIREIVQRFIGPGGLLTRGIQSVTRYLEGDDFKTMLDGLYESIDNIVERITTTVNSMISGETSFVDGIKQIIFGDIDPRTASMSLWDRFKNFVGLDNNTEGESLWDRFKNFVGLDNRIAQGQTIIETITNWFRDLMFGEIVDNSRPDGMGKDIREGGLMSVIKDLVGMQGNESIGGFAMRMIGEISNNFTNLIATTEASFRNLIGMGNLSLGDYFTNLIATTEASFRNLIGMGDQSLSSFLRNFISDVLGTSGQSVGAWFGSLLDRVNSDIARILNDIELMMNRIISSIEINLGRVLSNIPGLSRAGENVENRGEVRRAEVLLATDRSAAGHVIATQVANLMMEAEQHRRTVLGAALFGSDYTRAGQTLLNRAAALAGVLAGDGNGLPLRLVGTLRATGQTSEPKDTVAQIHAGERVLNAEETNEYNSRSNQENQRPMLEKLDQLNSTMMTVASLLTQELSIQTRTMQNIRGLGTDLMKGMPQ